MNETPVVAVYEDGRVQVGPGRTIGDVLAALERVRNTVLGIVLNREAPHANEEPTAASVPVGD